MDDELRLALRQKDTISVVEAGKAFGLSRGSAYEAVKNGQIPSIKIGGRICVPTAPLRKMLQIEAA